MRNICLFFLCSLSLPALSQSLRPGYILQNKDTIKGFIKYREYKSSLRKCTFINAANGTPQTYSPTEIEGFGFETRHFISLKKDSSVLFVELIVEGRSNLLRAGSIYYVQKDSEFVSLEPIKKEVFQNNNAHVIEDKTFAGKLRHLFSDCSDPELIKRINGISLGNTRIEKTFTKIVSSYNACVNSSSKTYSIKSRKSITFGLYVGVYNSSGILVPADKVSKKPDFSPSNHFTGGLFINCMDPRISEKFRLQVELNYFAASLDGIAKYSNAYELRHFEYTGIRIPVSLSYKFLSGSFSPYVSAGISPSFFISRKSTEETHDANSVIRSKEGYDLRSNAYPLLAGVGIEKRLKNRFLFIEFRYNSSFNILDRYLHDSFSVRSFDVLAGIRM